MTLTKTWAPFFQPRSRMLGRRDFMAGRVKQLPPEAGELVRASVEDGGKPYIVTIHGEGPRTRVHCTCPQFGGGLYCQHVWATLVEVQENGIQQTAGGNGHSEDDADNGEPATTLGGQPTMPKARRRDASRAPKPSREPEWIGRLSLLRPASVSLEDAAPAALPMQQILSYVIRAELSARTNSLVVEMQHRQAMRSGWGKMKPLKINEAQVTELADPIDRELCALLLGASPLFDEQHHTPSRAQRSFSQFRLPAAAQRTMLRRMIDTGRCYVSQEYENPAAITWDDQSDRKPWTLWMKGQEDGDELSVRVELRRQRERLSVEEPTLILGGPEGVLIHNDVAAAFDDREAFRWVVQFREDMKSRGATSELRVPADDIDRFLDRLYMLPQLPEIDLPSGIGRREQHINPRPALELLSDNGNKTMVGASVWFEYDVYRVRPGQPGRYVATHGGTAQDVPDEAATPDEGGGVVVEDVPDEAGTPGEVEWDVLAEAGTPGEGEAQGELQDSGVLIRRQRRLEEEALASLTAMGFRPAAQGDGLVIPSKSMSSAVRDLILRGWKVTADAKVLRRAANPTLRISSGIDWFELRGGFTYQTDGGEEVVSLPEILKAARSGQSMITLSDGSQGMLPEEWLAEHGLLAAAGDMRDDHLRFGSMQAALLDALLDEQNAAIEADAKFLEARQRIQKFRKLEPADPAESFEGTLRPYQREGLGWLRFLRWFGMGGILADDMGLGKTIQVLGLLDAHYQGADGTGESTPTAKGEAHRPSLVVAPRSVVHNWIDEAAKFTPKLRVLAYDGTDRQQLRDAFDRTDLIVTSYGLLRRDATELVDHDFEFVILDEAQAIKNPQSQGAKAARLIRARHRLALTGTPVENHLGDLWSIFEFLNPGMLGVSARFNDLIKAGVQDTHSVEAAAQAGRALRPFILRRTKQQVLSDLPEKTEQTLLCEMEGEQRKLYDELKQHYRNTLLSKIDPGAASVTQSGSTMIVLEALLRLRQAACHPGLIDPGRTGEPSAKLDTLMEQLEELQDEGHKALVFSQFTSMLAIVRERLDERKWTYEYLDGQTRDRRSCVDRFQKDPDCGIFLISLKAGGLGLNLTAAEYVFILDPWWNPAVEQQAIDRAHRIGQTQHVFAYRLICEDTVEQRIAELQAQKRQLADAIVGGEQSILRSLTRDDLEQLLS